MEDHLKRDGIWWDKVWAVAQDLAYAEEQQNLQAVEKAVERLEDLLREGS